MSPIIGILLFVIPPFFLGVLLYWADKPAVESRDPFCAWCVYRSGDDCTHPDSPVTTFTC